MWTLVYQPNLGQNLTEMLHIRQISIIMNSVNWTGYKGNTCPVPPRNWNSPSSYPSWIAHQNQAFRPERGATMRKEPFMLRNLKRTLSTAHRAAFQHRPATARSKPAIGARVAFEPLEPRLVLDGN